MDGRFIPVWRPSDTVKLFWDVFVANAVQSRLNRLLALYLSTLPWMPAAAATVFIKTKLMGGGEVLEESQIFLMVREAGRAEAGGFATAGRILDQLSFYRSDLLWALWIAPAVLAIAAMTMPVRIRAWFVAAVSAAAITLLYFQRQAAFGAGGFVSWQTLADGAAWGIAHPGEIGNYLQPGGLARVGFLLAAVAGLAYVSGRFAAGSGAPPIRRATVSALAMLAILTAAAWIPTDVTVWAHTGVYEHVADAVFDIDGPPPDVRGGDPAMLASAYRELTDAPRGTAPSIFDGKAKGYNLIVVVLETTPKRILDLSGPLDRMPNLRRLRDQAWIGLRHHTTHPRSDRAFFSILTSFYSADLDRVFKLAWPFPGGMLNDLRQQGYRTGLYLPNGDVFDFEISMWRSLGLETLVAPAPRANEPGFWFTDWKIRDRLDREALGRMLDDITEMAASDVPFATVFYPQLGHAPWPDIRDDGREQDVQRRGEEIVVRQDRLFGAIIETLEARGVFDRTLIVVTGDHGIRIRPEDPAIPVGKVDAYSFQVPFLLYAPGIVERAETIGWVTSHIDISPTIAALFGLEVLPGASQGSPVWDERIEGRTTFFWSLDYHGAAGYHREGQFAMWNTFYDRVYLNDALAFEAEDAAPKDSEDYSRTKATIRRMDEINARWVEGLLDVGTEALADR